VDGKRVSTKGEYLSLSPHSKRVSLNWHWKEHPDLSYDRAVELWQAKDRDRSTDRNFLFPHPVAPKIEGDSRAFATETHIKLRNPSGIGEIRYTTDGSDPKLVSTKYTGPIKVSKSTLIKAASFWPDGRVSEPLWAKLEVGFADIPALTTATVSGVVCEVFSGKFATLPEFGTLKPARTLMVGKFGLEEPDPKEEFYALRFTGVIEIPMDGVYRFWTGSDDGSRMWIGRRQVVDNDGLHAYEEVPGDIVLKKGKYPIKVGFFEAGGGHILKVFWSGPGFEKQEIPATSLGH
jgi:hypothetical protein